MAESVFDVTVIRRRLLSGSAWALGGRVILALTGVTTNALLARLLAPQELGAYFLAYSIVWAGAILGSLGLNQAVIRFVSESMTLGRHDRARRVILIVFTMGTLGSLGVGLAYLLLGRFLSETLFDSPALLSITGLVAGWMIILSFQNLLAETFRGFHDIRLAALFGGASTGILLVASLSVLLWLDGHASLVTVVLFAAGSGMVSAVVAGWLLRWRVKGLTVRENESSLRFTEIMGTTWPLLISGLILFFLTQVDIWILGAFRSQEEVAIYGAAARLVTLVAMPLLVVNAVVPPLIAEMYTQNRNRELERILRSTATLAGIPAFIVLVGFMLFSGPVLSLVYGDFYRAGYLILAVLSVGRIVNVWGGSCGLALTMTGHQRSMMSITVFSGLLTVIGTLWAVRGYGAEGVAIVTSTMLILQNVLMVLLARLKVGVWTHASFSVKELRGVFSK